MVSEIKDMNIEVEVKVNTSNTFKAINILDVLEEIRNTNYKYNPYRCSLCGKQTTTTIGLMRHQKQLHNEVVTDKPICEEPFKCEWCPDTFKTAFDFAVHRRIDHKPEIGEERYSI